MTLGIGFRGSDGRAVLACAREIRAPFSPSSAVEEFATVLKSYNCLQVEGDRYAGEWPREAFRQHGIEYVQSTKTKNEIYLSFLPILNSQRCELLDLPRLVNQIANLERRTHRGGKDSIDHAVGAHDDLANAVAGCLVKVGGEMSGLEVWQALGRLP